MNKAIKSAKSFVMNQIKISKNHFDGQRLLKYQLMYKKKRANIAIVLQLSFDTWHSYQRVHSIIRQNLYVEISNQQNFRSF